MDYISFEASDVMYRNFALVAYPILKTHYSLFSGTVHFQTSKNLVILGDWIHDYVHNNKAAIHCNP